MEDQRVSEQLLDIQNQLQSISLELAAQKRHREEMQELKHDLTLVAKDVLSTTIEELEDVAPFVRTGDFMYLVKRILRNTNNITDVISKLESVLDFAEDGGPVAKELFNDGLQKLDELDRAGYFEFMKSSKSILDNVVKTYQNLDVDQIEEYSIWKLMKEMNKPEMKKRIGFAMHFLKNVSNKEINN